MHTNGLGRTIKVVNGLPSFYSYNDLYGCDVFFTYNIRITAAGYINKLIDAMEVNQVLILDLNFMIQKPYDKERTERLTGINGEQAYLLM